MNLPLYIARRYLFSKKSHNVINVISIISVVAVAFVSMALVIILSAFNGIEGLVISLYNSFDSDIRISPSLGKTMVIDDDLETQLRNVKGVVYYTDVIEENALIQFKDMPHVAIIKGVEEDFVKMSELESMMVDGSFTLEEDNRYYAVFGNGIAYNLSLDVRNEIDPVNLIIPKRSKKSQINPKDAFYSKKIYPSGFFSVQQEFDNKYIIVSLDFAREFLEYGDKISAIEIGISKDADLQEVQQQIVSIMGSDYTVKNQFQQKELMYKTIQSEKLIIFLILGFILIIAIFNSVGSLTLLILEKKKDILVLKSMGARKSLIKKIFLFEGLFISTVGAVIGIVIGLLVCLGQIHFGWIPIGDGDSFVVDSYPVEIHTPDIFIILLSIIVIGFLAAWYPISVMSKRHLQ